MLNTNILTDPIVSVEHYPLLDDNNSNYSSVNSISSPTNTNQRHHNIKCPISIHFGAVAWGCGFYVGVLKALEERYGSEYHKMLESVHGDSAGVIFALGIAIGESADKMDILYRTVSKRCHAEGLWNNKCVIDAAIDQLLADPETYIKVKHKLSLGVTEFPLHHVRYSEWTSNEDLRDCLHGSMYLPLYCDPVPPINGRHVIDGGFSFAGKYLSHGNDTLFVGIDPNAEVSGDMSLWEMAFPMVDHKYDAAVAMGYESMMSWNGDMKDKIANRHKNWVGYIFWWFKVVSVLINIIIIICVMIVDTPRKIMLCARKPILCYK